MATTTNYSWTTPDDTDLVKDGAAAIRTLGSSIDTTVFNNAGAAVTKSLIDAEGDLIVGDAADAVQRLAIGSNGNVLTVDTTVDGKIKWAAPAGGGKVLQVVQATYSTSTQSTSATYADTGLSLSITPSSATSKVLVLVNQSTYSLNSSDPTYMGLRIVRASTAVLTTAGAWALNFAVTGAIIGYTALTYLDSPNTTSATTYKTQFNRSTGAGSVTVQESSYPSIITLMEIGA